MPDDDKLAEIRATLDQNKSKEFVRRILDPENSPSMDLGKGWTGTHLMAAEFDPDTEKWMVFPTIVMMDGQLKQLEVNEAMHHAKATNEFIDFGGDKDKAISFSKNYKKVWESE